MSNSAPLYPPLANPLPVADSAAEALLTSIANDVGDIPSDPAREGGHLATIDTATTATAVSAATIATNTGRIPSSPATDRVTAAAPGSVRLSDGSAFYKTTTPSDTQPVSSIDLGAKADAAASSDTGTFSLISLSKRELQSLTSLIALLPPSLGAKLSVVSLSVAPATDSLFPTVLGVGTAVLGTSTSPVTPPTILLQNAGDFLYVTLPSGFNAARFVVTSLTAAINFTFDYSLDGGTTWSTAYTQAGASGSQTNVTAATTSTSPGAWVAEAETSTGTTQIRARLTSSGLTAGQLVCSLTPVVKNGRPTQNVNIGGSAVNLLVAGVSAHSAAASGNPVQIAGAVAIAADTTLVNNDTAELLMTTHRQAVTKANAGREWEIVFNQAISVTTDVAVKAATASLRNIATSLQISNRDSVAHTFSLKDGASTVVWGPHQVAAGGYIHTSFQNHLSTTSVNTALNVAMGEAVVTTNPTVSVQGYQGV